MIIIKICKFLDFSLFVLQPESERKFIKHDLKAIIVIFSEVEFKEFEPWFEFEPVRNLKR